MAVQMATAFFVPFVNCSFYYYVRDYNYMIIFLGTSVMLNYYTTHLYHHDFVYFAYINLNGH